MKGTHKRGKSPKLLTLKDIIGDKKANKAPIVPVGYHTWTRWMKEGKVPQPVDRSRRPYLWQPEEVYAALEKMGREEREEEREGISLFDDNDDGKVIDLRGPQGKVLADFPTDPASRTETMIVESKAGRIILLSEGGKKYLGAFSGDGDLSSCPMVEVSEMQAEVIRLFLNMASPEPEQAGVCGASEFDKQFPWRLKAQE